MRPFFGFFGGKWRDTPRHYPEPKYDTIIEPFAGSAGYAVRFSERNVILCEIDPVIAGVWKYLIRVKPSEILKLPNIAPGQSIDDLKLPQEARWLIGFWLNRGVASPRKHPSKWMRDGVRPGSFWGERVRATIAWQVEQIRHWKIYNCSYQNCPTSKRATWFVDPPYQRQGNHYRYGADQMDYGDLAKWCKSRRGQVIVCENHGAKWLPFKKLADVKTTRSKRSLEVVWIRELRGDKDDSHSQRTA